MSWGRGMRMRISPSCIRRGASRGLSPAQLAMVTVLEFIEDLTDRQAADAVRGHVDWKYCLGLELEDEGFSTRSASCPGSGSGWWKAARSG